ncbi:MAG: NAD(P)/FAD-dependent oxidoreductase [Leptospiraceae bacterium]|nr:NAD(P)/FAD-dependent oxidoreductase [Leptospiraceae bacterium]
MQKRETSEVIIAGTGFAGLCMAIQLKRNGIDSFIILEKESEYGGTWRLNNYPGAACDVQSHLYSYSFEPYPYWTKMFGPRDEILDYVNFCVEKYGLEKHIRLNEAVTSAVFRENEGRWDLETSGGSKYESKFFVSATGGLSQPIIPKYNGMEDYQGKMFHSARWDHNYKVKNKKIAVVGTGASAIQIVPTIAPEVEKLYLFQRSAAWVLPKPDRDILSIERGLFKFLPISQTLYREYIYWSLELRVLGLVVYPEIMKVVESLAKKHIEKSIEDEELRKTMTPDYTIGCKRVLMSNEYYPAINRKNVKVETSGIEKFTNKGILTGSGEEIELDAVIMATGFQGAEAIAPYKILGKGQKDLNEAWKNGAEAYLGTTISGFPNFFMIVGPNTGLGHSSMIFMIESQVQYALQAIMSSRKNSWKFIDVRQEIQDNYNRKLQLKLDKTIWASDCVSWYRTRNGKNTTLWPGFTFDFRLKTLLFNPQEYEIMGEEGKLLKPDMISSFFQQGRNILKQVMREPLTI